MSNTEQLGDALHEGGYTDDEVACVEDHFKDDYGSVDDAMDAIRDDAKLTLRPMLTCRNDGLSNDVADCYFDAIADHYGVDALTADDLVQYDSGAGPADRRLLAAASLVRQGLPQPTAACTVDEMEKKFPKLFDGQPLPLTSSQREYMLEAAAGCGDD